MHMLCLDVEGVLFPELWIKIAESLCINDLKITTQNCPDYNALMAHRVAILQARGVTLDVLKRCIAGVSALPEARAFVDEVRRDFQLVLVSDSFYEFLLPLVDEVGSPTLFCHNLLSDSRGHVCGWRPRLQDQKPKVVRAMHELGFTVYAAGDSYNDLGMLEAADRGWFVNAPAHITHEFPHIACAQGLSQLLDLLQQARQTHQDVASELSTEATWKP